MVGLTPRWRYGVTHHLPSTLTTVEQATRKLPSAAPFARRAEVVLDVPPRSLNHLLRNLRIGDRHGYPLLSGLYSVSAAGRVITFFGPHTPFNLHLLPTGP